jgi:hypothetical protein
LSSEEAVHNWLFNRKPLNRIWNFLHCDNIIYINVLFFC